MSGHRRYTRSDKYGKRQRNKRKVLFFSSLSFLFLIVFISLLVFGNKGNPQEAGGEQSADTDEIQEENDDTNQTNNIESDEDIANDSSSPQDTTITPDESDEEEETSDVIVEEIPTDEENVIAAYRGNWEPMGTKQEGPHTINYNDGSDDRIEIKRAVAMVTELDSADIVEHWIGRGGDQAVVATVYDINSQDDIYRVYLQWIDDKGWQPTKMEKLKYL